MPEALDLDAGVGEQGEREGADEIHHERKRGGETDEQHAGPRASDEAGGEEQAGEDAGDEAADAAARLLDADGGGAQLEDVAMADGGDAEQVQGAQDVLRDHELQAECQPRVSAGRDGRAEQPQRDRRDGAPVEGNEADCSRGEYEQPRGQQEDKGDCQREADEVVRPAEGGGVESAGGEGEEAEEQAGELGGEGDPFDAPARAGLRRVIHSGGSISAKKTEAAAAAFAQEQQEDHGHEEPVGQVGILPPVRPEDQAQREGQRGEQEGAQPGREGEAREGGQRAHGFSFTAAGPFAGLRAGTTVPG